MSSATPLMDGPSAAGQDGPSSGDAASERLTVLIADSQTLFARALGRVLAKQPGFAVIDAYPESGVEAARAAVALRPSVAVLDYWLEGVTGPGATRSVIAKAPHTKVVLLGWFHSTEHVARAFDAGAAGFVSKGLPLADLVEAIRQVAGGDRVVAERDGGPRGGGEWVVERPAHSATGDPLTPRELEVLRLLGAGLPVEDVAARLEITRETARTHLTRILTKTGAHSQLQALAAARAQGFLV